MDVREIANDARKQRPPRGGLMKIMAALLLGWFLLGGVVIQVDESFIGGRRVETNGCTHTVWVNHTIYPTRLWFLGISWDFIGAPYGVTLSSDAVPGTTGKILVDSIRLEKANGTSTEIIRHAPVIVPYDGDTYRAPTVHALENFDHLPLTFGDDDGGEVTLKARVLLAGKSPEDLVLKFAVRRAKRQIRVIPFWLALYEYGQAG